MCNLKLSPGTNKHAVYGPWHGVFFLDLPLFRGSQSVPPFPQTMFYGSQNINSICITGGGFVYPNSHCCWRWVWITAMQVNPDNHSTSMSQSGLWFFLYSYKTSFSCFSVFIFFLKSITCTGDISEEKWRGLKKVMVLEHIQMPAEEIKFLGYLKIGKFMFTPS